MELVLGAVLGICFFFIPIWCYRRGLRDGMAVSQGKELQPITKPFRGVKKPSKSEIDKLLEGFNNMMTYDGTPQKGGEDD